MFLVKWLKQLCDKKYQKILSKALQQCFKKAVCNILTLSPFSLDLAFSMVSFSCCSCWSWMVRKAFLWLYGSKLKESHSKHYSNWLFKETNLETSIITVSFSIKAERQVSRQWSVYLLEELSSSDRLFCSHKRGKYTFLEGSLIHLFYTVILKWD